MKHRGRSWFFLSIAFVACIGVIVLYMAESHKILSVEPTAWTQDQSADCAVVLTGGSGRVREGFDLLAQNRVKKLIISGVYPAARLREIFPEWPYYGPISEDDVILDRRSNTTFGNAQQTLPLVEALKCESMILVTSRVHMYRSFKIFRKVYGPDMPIYRRAIVSGEYDPNWLDISLEATKSIFYSVWAY